MAISYDLPLTYDAHKIDMLSGDREKSDSKDARVGIHLLDPDLTWYYMRDLRGSLDMGLCDYPFCRDISKSQFLTILQYNS